MKSLNSLVTKEAKALLLNATESELSNLDFGILNSKNRRTCVYGQMTNDCFNNRATRLIELCCDRVYNADPTAFGISGILNGSPMQKARTNYWSPIEVFIDIPSNKTNGNNEVLIAFLKGERKTLRFAK